MSYQLNLSKEIRHIASDQHKMAQYVNTINHLYISQYATTELHKKAIKYTKKMITLSNEIDKRTADTQYDKPEQKLIVQSLIRSYKKASSEAETILLDILDKIPLEKNHQILY